MNTPYVNNLQDAVEGTIDGYVEQQTTTSGQESATKMSMYYAHGETETAAGTYEKALETSDTADRINNSAVEVTTEAGNVVTSATQASTDAENAKNNVSSAANSIQLAANSISTFYKDVSALFSVAQTQDMKTDLYKLTQKARDAARKAACIAEEASLKALDATIVASRTVAPTVLENATTAEANATTVSDATTATNTAALENFQASNTALIEANKLELEAVGNYNIAKAENTAVSNNLEEVQMIANGDLNVQVLGRAGDAFQASFDAFISPYDFRSDCDGIEENNKPEKYENVVKNYYAFIVPKAEETNMNADYAWKNRKNGYAFAPTANPPAKIIYDFFTYPEVIEENGGREKPIEGTTVYDVADWKGNAVVKGANYVVFIFLEFTDEYKDKPSQPSNLLSLPSLPFILKADLETASCITITAPDDTSSDLPTYASVSFEGVANEVDVEYRLMLLNKADAEAARRNSGEDYISSCDQGDKCKEWKVELAAEVLAAKAIQEEIEQLNIDLAVAKVDNTNARGSMEVAKKVLQNVERRLDKNPDDPALKKAKQEAEKDLKAATALHDKTSAKVKKIEEKQAAAFEEFVALEVQIVKLEAKIKANCDGKHSDSGNSMTYAKGDSASSAFIFDESIAQSLLPGTYTTFDAVTLKGESVSGSVTLDHATTDNFGNLLRSDEEYSAVILAVYAGELEERTQYADILSNFSTAAILKYDLILG